MVVKSLPNQKWKFYWNGIQKTADHENSTIKIAGPDKIMEPAVLIGMNDIAHHLGSPDDVRNYCDKNMNQNSNGTSNVNDGNAIVQRNTHKQLFHR